MARLPKPGSDQGKWGQILNDYLSQVHTDTGTLKDNTVTSATIANNTITEDNLATDVVTKLNNTTTGTASAVPDTIARRTSTGAIKTVDAVEDDEAVTLGQIDDVTATLIADSVSATRTALSSTFELVISPEQFGAVGDGVADDGGAFQAALDYGKATGLYTCVRATPGAIYLVRNLNPKSNTLLNLTGATIQHGGSRVGMTAEGSSATINAIGTVEDPITNLRVIGGTVRGIRVDYTNITGVGGNDGLYFCYCPGVVVRDMILTEHGQDACTFDQCEGGKFIGNIVTNSGDAGIELRSGFNYEVHGNTFTKVGNGVASKPNVTDVRVESNVITSFREGILLHGFRWRIALNTILPTTADAYDGANYQGIRYADDWSASIVTLSGTDILITGNTIADRTDTAAFAALSLSGSNTLTNVKFLSNTITNCKRGIQMGVGSHILISDNHMTVTDRGVWLTAGLDMGTTISQNHITTSETNYSIDITALSTTIIGNSVTSATGGIRIASTATDCVITSNLIVQTAATLGLSLFAARCRASDNTIVTAGAAAISVQGADCIVATNTLRPIGGEGVLIGAAGSDTAGLRTLITTNRIIGGTQGVRIYGDTVAVVGNSVSGAQYWGINIMTGALAVLVTNNYLTGNNNGGLQDGGTSTTQANNVIA